MGKLIEFKTSSSKDPVVLEMKRISDEVDRIVLGALESQTCNPEEIATVLAHRLGSLMKNIDQKSALWDFCEKILKRQAHLDSS